MKFATRISSIRRNAWNTFSSCSPDSDWMWADSLASCALAGWMRSPRASSTAVTGCWASQSISRSGWSLRSSSAIATSRRAWPRPIGEETYSARLGREPARVQRPAAGGGQTNSRSSRFTFTGSRAFGMWPAPSSVTSAPPVASASASTLRERPDQVAVAVDHEHRAAGRARTSRAKSSPRGHADPARGVGQRLGRRLERPADAVLDLLGRVRLVEALGEEELEEVGVVPLPVVAVVLRPPLVGVERLVERVHVALGMARGEPRPRGRCRRSRRPARGGRRRGSSPTARRTTGRPASRARSSVASMTASASAANSSVLFASAPAGRSERPLPRPSNVTTRQWRARYGICIFHDRECTTDQVGSSSTVGSPSP